jgi:hypothetical protein
MDTAIPYQIHDSIVKLVILGLIRCSGRLPNSDAMDHVRKLDNSNVGTLELCEKRKHIQLIYVPYRKLKQATVHAQRLECQKQFEIHGVNCNWYLCTQVGLHGADGRGDRGTIAFRDMSALHWLRLLLAHCFDNPTGPQQARICMAAITSRSEILKL